TSLPSASSPTIWTGPRICDAPSGRSPPGLRSPSTPGWTISTTVLVSSQATMTRGMAGGCPRPNRIGSTPRTARSCAVPPRRHGAVPGGCSPPFMSDREPPAHWSPCPPYPPSEEALRSIPYADHAETTGPGEGALAIRFAGRQVRADRNDELLAAVIGPEYLD